MCHLSESLWTTNSNERQADSCDELSEWHKDKRDSTALGRGSDANSIKLWDPLQDSAVGPELATSISLHRTHPSLALGTSLP